MSHVDAAPVGTDPTGLLAQFLELAPDAIAIVDVSDHDARDVSQETAQVQLPAGTAMPPSAPSRRGERAHPGGRGETILVVEDERGIRVLTERILTTAGYRVLLAAGGRTALEAFEHADQPIDLMLTDVVMPEMLGPELVERATAIRPGLKVLYMSGYVQPAFAQPGVASPERVVVEKPFTADELLSRVRRALDERCQ